MEGTKQYQLKKYARASSWTRINPPADRFCRVSQIRRGDVSCCYGRGGIQLTSSTARLGSGNLRLAVVLPEGEDLNEWLAVNTVDFFNQINMVRVL